MEAVARDIVGPNLKDSDKDFIGIVAGLFAWAHNA
jgi:hypothetical protein